MKTKWYVCILLIAFSFFGAFQENTTVPNQEIVLEFVDLKISKNYINTTISDVKEKLINAGASNIKVLETKNGALKISYYSVINVDNIKEILSKNNLLAFNNHSKNKEENYPSSKNLSNYNIDIYELDNDTNISSFGGNAVLEIKYDFQRYTNTQNHASLENISINKANKLFKTAYKFNKSIVIIKENTSNYKPEVRAGPNYL